MLNVPSDAYNTKYCVLHMFGESDPSKTFVVFWLNLVKLKLWLINDNIIFAN